MKKFPLKAENTLDNMLAHSNMRVTSAYMVTAWQEKSAFNFLILNDEAKHSR
jgi:hypothetical protein